MISPGGSGGINGTVSTKQGNSDTQMSTVVTKKPFEFDRNSQKKLQLYSETVYFDENGKPKPSGTPGGQLQSQQLSTTQNQSSHVLPPVDQNGIQGQPVNTQIRIIHQHPPVQQNSPMNSDFVQQYQIVHSQSACVQQQSTGLQQPLLMNPQPTYIQQIQPVMQQPPQIYHEAVHQPMQKILNAHIPQLPPIQHSRIMNTNNRSSHPQPLMQLNTNHRHQNRQHYNPHQVQVDHIYQNVYQHLIPNGQPTYIAPPNAQNRMLRVKQLLPQSSNRYFNNCQNEQNWCPPGSSHATVINQNYIHPSTYNSDRHIDNPHSSEPYWKDHPNSSYARQHQRKEVAPKQTEVKSNIMPSQGHASLTELALGIAPPSQIQAVEKSQDAENGNFDQISKAKQEVSPKAVETIQKEVGITGPSNPNIQNQPIPASPVIQAEFNGTSVDMTPSPSISPASEDDGHVDHFPSLQQAQQQSKQKKLVSKSLTYSEKVKQGNLSEWITVGVKKEISLVKSVKIASTAMSHAVGNNKTAGPQHSKYDQKAVSSGFMVRDKINSPTSHTSFYVKPRNTANVKFVHSGPASQKDSKINSSDHNRYSRIEAGETCTSSYRRPNRRRPETRSNPKQLDSIVEEKATDPKGSPDGFTAQNSTSQTGKKHAIPTIFVNGKKATLEQLVGNQKRPKSRYQKKSARERRVNRQHNSQNEKETADLQNIKEEEEPDEPSIEINPEVESVSSQEIKIVLDPTDNFPISESTVSFSTETSNNKANETKSRDKLELNAPDVSGSVDNTLMESHLQLNEASTEIPIFAEHSPPNKQTSNDSSTQSIGSENLQKTENAKNDNKEKPAARKSKSQKKKEKKKQKKLAASENTEFSELVKTENTAGPERPEGSNPTTSEQSNPPTNSKLEKKKRIEEMRRKRGSLKFIQTVLPDYLYLGVKSLDFDCKKMAEKLVYYCHGLYQTRRCPLSLGLRDAETNTFFFESPTGFGKEVLNYLSVRPLLHWNRIENLDDCEDFIKAKIELYKNPKDATQKELHLLFRTMSKFHYSFFYEDIFYIMSKNYDEEQAKLKDIEYLEFIEKLTDQQINDAVKTDWPTPEELQKHITTKIGNEYCSYFINYIMRQYSCRIFFNLESSEVHFQEEGMLNLCKKITEAAIGWSPYNTEEFYHEMLEGLKDMEQTPKVQLYETFWKFMLEITSFICDEDVYIMQERLDCNPENIVHHDYLFKLWFGYGLLNKFE